jgi:uncharacterized membrane protein
MRTKAPFQRIIERIEGDARVDRALPVADQVATKISQSPAAPALRGDWLGHAAHPMFTDYPLGCWIGAGLLDLVGGRKSRSAAQRLVALGLLTALPTAASGWTEFDRITDDRTRRVGVVHAFGNTAVIVLYLLSWRHRAKGQHLRGKVFGMVGGVLAYGTGFLGGHLSFGRGVGHGTRGSMDRTPLEAPIEDIEDVAEAAALLNVPGGPTFVG